MSETSSFDQSISKAEKLNALGRPLAAAMSFSEAQEYALECQPPHYLGAVRALRGYLQCTQRAVASGEADSKRFNLGLSMSRLEDLHTEAERQAEQNRDPEGLHQARRERVQTANVAARILLGRCIAGERTTGNAPHADKVAAIELARQNWGVNMPSIERDGVPDQYRVNGASAIAAIEILYGKKQTGAHIARRAIGLGRRSESRHVAYSANRGPLYGTLARSRALTRAVAISAAAKLDNGRPQSLRRSAALWLANCAV